VETAKVVVIAPRKETIEALVSELGKIGCILWRDGPYPLKQGDGYKIYVLLTVGSGGRP